MKSLLKTIGLIAVAAIIGFTFTACGDDPGGDDGPSGGPIALTVNQWKEGKITSANGYVEYTFSAEYLPTYRIWWNDKGQGDGSYSGDIVVSAFRSNGEAISNFANVDSAWITAKSYSAPISPYYSNTETIRLRVELKDKAAANAGTFAIVYTTTNSKPVLLPSSATPLTAGVWKDGTIAANGADWYSLSVTKDARYYFWWNETGSNGNGTKSANINVSAWYSNGTVVDKTYYNSFLDEPTAWSTPISFEAASTGTVYVRVAPYNNTSAGTYGIVYNTSNTKPAVTFSVTATPLVEAVWADGNLPDTGSMDWYSISVTNGTQYYLWWNESGSYGNGTKTGDVQVSVMNNDGVALSSTLTDRDSSWSGTPASFEADYTGTVYVKVVPYSGSSSYYNYTGTYGIVYNTTNTRPIAYVNVEATPLIADQWEDGDLPTANSVDWYSIAVTNGTQYHLWWNESGSYGNGTKTGDIKVSAMNNEATYYFSDRDYSWSGTGATFTSSYDGIAYVKVVPYSSSSSYYGTYGIVYSTGNTRPSIPIDVPSSATPLTVNQWEDGDLTTATSVDWYSISVTDEATYNLWWNESGSDGNGTKTGNVMVTVATNEGEVILDDINTSWGGTPASFEADYTGTVYVRVKSYNSYSFGTYGIVYSTDSTRPIAYLNVEATPLTANKWEDGNLPTVNSMDWYSISVTDGTPYQLWWNERGSDGDGTKTANVKVTVLSNDGTVLLAEKDYSWSGSGTPASFTPASAGTVYVRVVPSSSSYTGTYGIVYSTGATRPLIPIPSDAVDNAIPLTENIWKDGNLPNANSVDWYSFSVNNGSAYRLWSNDSYAGDNSKTGEVKISVMANDGTSFLDNEYGAWSTSRGFTADFTGTVYVRVIPYGSSYTGTYGIVYSTGASATRPLIPVPNDAVSNAIQLTADQWKDGNLTTATSMDWYSISVVSGTTYRLWTNEYGTWNGDGSKTGEVRVSVKTNVGTILVDNATYLWDTPRSFAPDFTGTVYVRVIPYGSYYTGTYGIVYSTGASATRPLVPSTP